MYSWCTRKCIFPLMALLPPVGVAYATNSLEFLVGITGSYAGNAALTLDHESQRCYRDLSHVRRWNPVHRTGLSGLHEP
jgi:hypothetical protein